MDESQPRAFVGKMLRPLVGLCAGLLLIGGAARAEDVIHIYNWNDYIGSTTIERFEKFCNCKVKYDTYGDNDELLAKLEGGASGYDIMVPTGNAVETLIKKGALLPIDKSQLPDFKNLNPGYLNQPFDPGNKYSVPYASSLTIIGYNEQKVKELGIPTDTWAAIFDPSILAKVKGKVTVLDSPSELFAAALKYLGYPVNDTDEKHWQEAKNVILKAKPYWQAFNNTGYIRGLVTGSIWLVHGYSNDFFQANLRANEEKRKHTIGSSIPKEGAVFALDNMVIHKSAPRPDLAHKFINFMLDPRNSAELTNMTGSGTPNAAAMKLIKPEVAQTKAVALDAETLKKLESLVDMDSKKLRVRSRLWTEIKVKRAG
jgi:spermidine/putrescine transport system substrate-binding protein